MHYGQVIWESEQALITEENPLKKHSDGAVRQPEICSRKHGCQNLASQSVWPACSGR
jgi:hypothetical protein